MLSLKFMIRQDMNKAKNVKTQVEMDNTAKALLTAFRSLTKRDTDLQITKIKRSRNSYKITIKNFGRGCVY